MNLRRPLLYITRLEYRGRRPSWWLRFPSETGLISHTFRDDVYRGKARALAAAKAAREKLLSIHIPVGYQSRPHRHAAGVYFDVQMQGGRRYPSWIASWMQDGQKMKKRFSFGRVHSSSKAKRLAKEWRERMLARVRDPHAPRNRPR